MINFSQCDRRGEKPLSGLTLQRNVLVVIGAAAVAAGRARVRAAALTRVLASGSARGSTALGAAALGSAADLAGIAASVIAARIGSAAIVTLSSVAVVGSNLAEFL